MNIFVLLIIGAVLQLIISAISLTISVLVMRVILRSKVLVTRISLAKHFNLFMFLLFLLNFMMFISFSLNVLFPLKYYDMFVVVLYVAVADAFLLYVYLVVRK